MKKRSPCFICALALGVLAAFASAQDIGDPLAQARAAADAHNQRVLLLLAGGDPEVTTALSKAMRSYGGLGKLLRYEYRPTAVPAASVAGKSLRKQLGLQDAALPTLAILDARDQLLGTMTAAQMTKEGRFSTKRVRSFLDGHGCAPRDASAVLTSALDRAKQTKRQVLVYLSAPW